MANIASLLLFPRVHAGKLFIHFGPTFFVTKLLCEYLSHSLQIWNSKRYFYDECFYCFRFFVFLLLWRENDVTKMGKHFKFLFLYIYLALMKEDLLLTLKEKKYQNILFQSKDTTVGMSKFVTKNRTFCKLHCIISPD